MADPRQTEADIYAGLSQLFSDVFNRDDIALTPATTAADVQGWDSFKQIEIIMGVEELFGIKLSSREIDGLNTVGDLAGVIRGKV